MSLKSMMIAAAAAICVAAPAQAALLTATWATSGGTIAPFNTGTAFTIDFDDSLGTVDDVFEIAELTSFSGISFATFVGGATVSRDTVVGVPDIPGVSALGGAGSLGWLFGVTGSGTGTSFPVSEFTYGVEVDDPDSDPVPTPASLSLLLVGLAAVGAARRHKARA